jgi:hypothetical protein
VAAPDVDRALTLDRSDASPSRRDVLLQAATATIDAAAKVIDQMPTY